MIEVTIEQPGGRAPAPGPLAIVQAFVNTTDREAENDDDLSTVAGLREWLGRVGLPGGSALTEEDRELAITLREGIRSLSRLHSGFDDDASAVEKTLTPAIDALGLMATLADGRVVLSGSTPLGRSLAPVIDGLRAGMDDGSWLRLKVCHRDACQWLFYDSSRNQASHWCATSICGSREKARRAYKRKTGTHTA